MFERNLQNRKGFTLLEVMIAMAISLVLLRARKEHLPGCIINLSPFILSPLKYVDERFYQKAVALPNNKYYCVI